MKKKLMTRFNTLEWRSVDKDGIYVVFDMLGFKSVEDVVQLRVFELLNLNRINNNRAEEMLLCIYRLLYPNRKLDDGIFNDEIDQYFSYREWKKSHKKLDQVTVSDILLTEGTIRRHCFRIFDGVTAAFTNQVNMTPQISVQRFERIAEIQKQRRKRRTAMGKPNKEYVVPLWEKTNLTVYEAAAYSGIGADKLRELSDREDCEFVLWNGTKRLIKRKKLDEFLDKAYSI